jgi:hypothetical protein
MSLSTIVVHIVAARCNPGGGVSLQHKLTSMQATAVVTM